MGRKKIPLEVKRARGTVQKCRTNSDAPRPPLEVIAPPPPIPIPDAAAWVWDYVTGEMALMGTLTHADLMAVAVLCLEWAEYYEARTLVDSQGRRVRMTFKTDDEGKLKSVHTHPSVLRGNAAVGAVMRMIAELGLSPTSRERLTVKKHKEDPERARARTAMAPRSQRGLKVLQGGQE
jgi:P27 family predicted phage terminase small subunit